jgi:small subunit ribosomal protein S17
MGKDDKKVIKGMVSKLDGHGTIVVVSDSIKSSRLYNKKYTRSKNIKVHDPSCTVKVGDIIQICGTRPISKDKHFKIFR